MSTIQTILATQDLGQVISTTVSSITEYLKHKEEHKTERERIEACLNAITKKMETDRLKFESYMNKSFAEREKLYQRVDGLLNVSIAKGDVEMCKLALNFIISVYNKNPMDGYKESLQDVNSNLLSSGVKNYLD
jgi:hypothetical protein